MEEQGKDRTTGSKVGTFRGFHDACYRVPKPIFRYKIVPSGLDSMACTVFSARTQKSRHNFDADMCPAHDASPGSPGGADPPQWRSAPPGWPRGRSSARHTDQSEWSRDMSGVQESQGRPLNLLITLSPSFPSSHSLTLKAVCPADSTTAPTAGRRPHHRPDGLQEAEVILRSTCYLSACHHWTTGSRQCT